MFWSLFHQCIIIYLSFLMGICSIALCQPDSHSLQPQLSLKSTLLQTLKLSSTQPWYPFIKQTLLASDLPTRTYSSYKQPTRHPVRFTNQDIGQEMHQKYNRFLTMPASQKSQELTKMLTKTYMIIDESDLPNNLTQLLPQLSHHNLFGSITMTSSILSTAVEDTDAVQQRQQRLRLYDPVVMKSLEGFMGFCQKIQQELEKKESILTSMLLVFKTSIIQMCRKLAQVKTNEGRAERRNMISSSCNRFIFFLIEVVSEVYNIRKIQDKEGRECFYTEVNLFSLMTSLIFSDGEFTNEVKKVYEVSLAKEIEKLRQSPHVVAQKHPLPVEYSLDDRTLLYLKLKKSSVPAPDPVASLFKTTPLASEPYYKCLKMLSQLTLTSSPISKLKIIHQINLRIQKQISKFYQNHYLPLPKIDAEKMLEVVENIMSRCQDVGKIVVELMMVGDFVHGYYRMGRKGAHLAVFLAAVDEANRV